MIHLPTFLFLRYDKCEGSRWALFHSEIRRVNKELNRFLGGNKVLSISFLASELLFTAIWLIVRIAVWVKQRSIDWKREAVLILMYINLAVIIRFVFFPRALVEGHVQPLVFDATAVFPLRINLLPLAHLFDYNSIRDIIWNVVGNAAMFIPSGIVLPIVYRKLNSFWKVIAAGAFISLCIEILQLPFASRASDVDDLILNTLGVAVGYGIYAIVKHLKLALSHSRDSSRE